MFLNLIIPFLNDHSLLKKERLHHKTLLLSLNVCQYVILKEAKQAKYKEDKLTEKKFGKLLLRHTLSYDTSASIYVNDADAFFPFLLYSTGILRI